MARPPLHLVGGSAPGDLRLGSLRVGLVSSQQPPPEADALVVEDDTFHVLGAEPSFRPVKEHPIRAMTAAWEAEPTSPGTVWVRRDYPLEILAVVYDLAATPPTREEWIAAALARILDLCEGRRARVLALPPPGLRCGGLSAQDSLGALEQALRDRSRAWPRRLCLLTGSRERSGRIRSLLSGSYDHPAR